MSWTQSQSDWNAVRRGVEVEARGTFAPVQPDQHYHDVILGVSWALVGVCVLIIIARFYIRRRFFAKWFSDDWFMLMALIFQIAFGVCFTMSCIKSDTIVPGLPFNPEVLKWQIISGVFSMATPLFARLSGAILLMRLFKTITWFRCYLILMTVGTWISGVVTLVLLYDQVTPVEALWNPTIKFVRNFGPAPSQYAGIVNGVFIATTDLTFVLFPTIIVSRFNMSPRRKLGLVLVMLLSLITVAAAIIKSITTLSDPAKSAKMGFRPDDSGFFASLEQSLVIIIGSILPLMPVTKLDNCFVRFFKRVLGRLGSTGASPRRSARLPSFIRPAGSARRDGTQRLHSPEDRDIDRDADSARGDGSSETKEHV